MTQPSKPRYFVHSLEKGLSVLEAFCKRQEPVNLSELASLTKMGLPSATRYIRTLKDLGYLGEDPSSKKYSLTLKILSLGFESLNRMDIRNRLHPYLLSLNREFNVNANLAVLDGSDVVIVERIQAQLLVNLSISIGIRLPAYCTSLGRAILAFLDQKQQKKLIDEMEFRPLTRFTISDKAKLLKELAVTRRRGYAQQSQELSLGWANYAVPIFRGKMVEASCGASFPHKLIEKKEFVNSVLNRLLETAKKSSV